MPVLQLCTNPSVQSAVTRILQCNLVSTCVHYSQDWYNFGKYSLCSCNSVRKISFNCLSYCIVAVCSAIFIIVLLSDKSGMWTKA